MLVICSCLGSALFSQYLNSDQAINNYSQITRSLVTTFTYITTGENYNDLITTIVNEELENTNSLLSYFYIIIIINMFCLIPVLIFRFDSAYSKIGQILNERMLQIQKNAIVTSFIVLNVDNNQIMTQNEFDTLFRVRDIMAMV